ncbi:hypothetical protein KAM351_27050 [Aeromonas caviae]|uniref:Uncharacterized protein n=1 Tax=Aeromonas caviae TaxID=648 RepID=A0AA37CXY3_AERCA|nr:hypothetical protein [Aeromonas caviae]GJA64094.1 hypothetical protein KAM351_27050 [Aeromonas caviae]
MILALVGTSPDEVESVIDVAMAGRSKVQRFSVSHRPAGARPFALRAALERDRHNADWLTIVPAIYPDEVETVRALGGRVAHVYSMCAHPEIAIRVGDLMVACPGKRNAAHLVSAADLHATLRAATLAGRSRQTKPRA